MGFEDALDEQRVVGMDCTAHAEGGVDPVQLQISGNVSAMVARNVWTHIVALQASYIGRDEHKGCEYVEANRQAAHSSISLSSK